MTKRRIITWLLSVSVLAAFFSSWSKKDSLLVITDEQARQEVYTVVAVIDGDTIEVVDETGRRERVRYIGIDTPEFDHDAGTAECLAEEARRYNEALVAAHAVELTADVEEKDKYGRLLRYVSVAGRDVGESLLAAGYATLLTIPPNVARAEEYRAIVATARQEKLGLWGEVCKNYAP